jgi:hypothetical protein
MEANCEAEVQGSSVYGLMFEEIMNREQTVVCHFSTTEGTAISHIP